MRNTSRDVFWGSLAGRYTSENKDPGCFTYSFGFIVIIVVVGSIVSYLEEEILWLFGDSWEELVVLNMMILLVITAIIIFLENIALNNRIKSLKEFKLSQQDILTNMKNDTVGSRTKANKAYSYKSYSGVKLVLYILSFGIGYALIVGLDFDLISEALYDKSEETNGTLFPWIFWILLHYLSIPIEFLLKIMIVPFIQLVLVKIIMIPFLTAKNKKSIMHENMGSTTHHKGN